VKDPYCGVRQLISIVGSDRSCLEVYGRANDTVANEIEMRQFGVSKDERGLQLAPRSDDTTLI
jgi:hypothetical protein